MKENEMVFGIRAVIEAIQADKEVDKILVKRDLQGDLSKELFEVLRGREIPVQRVPAERLDRLTRKNHQGVIAFMSAVTYQSLEDIIPFVYEQGKDPFIVLLDGVTDVRNFGAIARTCECAGVDAIVIPAKGSVSVNADKDLIHQVIYNLVDNAVKFTNETGTIDFKVKTDSKKLTFTITNTGKGIPESELPYVFERFYKVDKSRSANKNSTGLGLYIVKTIVKAHGGSITAASRENQFTAFSVVLPLNN